jgi:hypothetical protein
MRLIRRGTYSYVHQKEMRPAFVGADYAFVAAAVEVVVADNSIHHVLRKVAT